jgi:MFS family permease
MITSSNLGLLFLAAVLIGLGLGAEGDVAAYMAGRYFPQHSYSRVLGFIYFVYAQGAAFGIFLLGQAFRITGTYVAVMWLIVAMVAISIVGLLAMGPYRYGLNHEELTRDEPATKEPIH